MRGIIPAAVLCKENSNYYIKPTFYLSVRFYLTIQKNLAKEIQIHSRQFTTRFTYYIATGL